jgi:hypothetical protein
MPSDDIRDLIGRYATGSLSEEEKSRLFAAALDDQELFDELTAESQIKELISEPGVHDRLRVALTPQKDPQKKPVTGWIWGVAATAALSVVMIVFFARQPKHETVAVLKDAAIGTPAPAPAPVSPPSQPPASVASAARELRRYKSAPPSEVVAQPPVAKKKTADRDETAATGPRRRRWRGV